MAASQQGHAQRGRSPSAQTYDSQDLEECEAFSNRLNPAADLTSVVDSNALANPVLPATAKVRLHELASENAVLKARLRSTVMELKNTRELCNKLSHQNSKLGGGAKGATAARGRADGASSQDPILTKDSAAQTKELKGLRPLSAAFRMSASSYTGAGGSLTTSTVAVQTTVAGRDCLVIAAGSADASVAAAMAHGSSDEIRRLKAEVLRSHAECASLQHAVQIMKTSAAGAGSSPGANSSPEARRAREAANLAVFGSDASPTGAAADLARTTHLQAMERIATLTEALKQANGQITELERVSTQLRLDIGEARSQKGSGYDGGRQAVPSKPLSANKGTITDDSDSSVTLPGMPLTSGPPAASVAARLDHSSALEQALEMTRAQLFEAMDEISKLRSKTSAAPFASATSEAALRSSVVEALSGRRSVCVGANFESAISEIFVANGIPFTADSAQELVALRLRHLEMVKHNRELEARALVATNSSAIRELQTDLESARKELMLAHKHIDELHYALDLEKRERFNPQNLLQRYSSTDDSNERQHLLIADEAQKQATAEISFLCDTLAATKSDAEMLRTQLQQASLERDAALHSFAELKARTESVLAGCQEITESTRADADAAIGTLTHTIHQKDTEIFALRGQIAAAQREFDKVVKQLSTAEKENDALKQRVTTVQSAMSKLREDSNAQSQQLRELRSQLVAQQQQMSSLSSPRGSSMHPTPRTGGARAGGGAGGAASPPGAASNRRATGHRSPSADAILTSPPRHAQPGMSSIEALQRALEEREAAASETRRLGDFSSINLYPQSPSGGAASSGRRASQPRQSTGSPARGAALFGSPSTAAQAAGPTPVDGMPYEEVVKEYEELRGCFLVLAAVAPNACTAREVTTAVSSAFDAQRERCAALERELKKRTTALQTLKKDLEAKRDVIADLEKKSSGVPILEQRISTLNKQVDKLKRAAVQSQTDHEDTDLALREKINQLEEELERTRVSLSIARQELMEGREYLLQLIGEDDEAIAMVAASRQSVASGVAHYQPPPPSPPQVVRPKLHQMDATSPAASSSVRSPADAASTSAAAFNAAQPMAYRPVSRSHSSSTAAVADAPSS